MNDKSAKVMAYIIVFMFVALTGILILGLGAGVLWLLSLLF